MSVEIIMRAKSTVIEVYNWLWIISWFIIAIILLFMIGIGMGSYTEIRTATIYNVSQNNLKALLFTIENIVLLGFVWIPVGLISLLDGDFKKEFKVRLA
jgi:TM2 domain-containing membrane protein YozV